MGHKVVSANGGGMGGYRRSCSRPILRSPCRTAKNSQEPVNGTYRGGTDHRKDGIAVGW